MAAQDPTAPIVKAATRPGNERPANLVPPAPSSPPGPALIPQALRQQAEDAALCGPEPPSELKMERLLTSRYGLLLTEVPSWNLVQRLRLQRQDAAAAVAKVQATLRARGRTQAAWHVGPSAPADLLPQLLELGMTPYEEPPLEAHSSCMVLMQPPEIEAPTDVVIERADTLEALAAAEAIAAAAFALRVEDRSAIQANLNTRLPLQRQNRAWLWQYVASIDGVPVGTARARFLNAGVNLHGAAVLPSARGRGVYRALVAARWREAVALGTPALTVQAGAMSRPILTKPSSALSPSPRSPSSATASNWPMTHTIPARSEHRQVVIHPGLLTERHRGSWSRPWREQDGGNAGSDAHQRSALGGRGWAAATAVGSPAAKPRPT